MLILMLNILVENVACSYITLKFNQAEYIELNHSSPSQALFTISVLQTKLKTENTHSRNTHTQKIAYGIQFVCNHHAYSPNHLVKCNPVSACM